MTGVFHTAFPQFAKHVEAVQARQHHVEQDADRMARARRAPVRSRRRRWFRGVALAGQPIAERQHQARFIFDEQQPLHTCDPCPCASGHRHMTNGLFAGGRKDDGEFAAFARLTAHADTAAVSLHDPLNEAEPEAGSLNARGNHLGCPIERLEDA